jgi:8-oxo-dGTP pyrophosphatase MutT (NUDIX family)
VAIFDDAFVPELRTRIVENLERFDRCATASEKRAAIAIVLVPVAGVTHYLFTQRALTMRRGAGQYALPGGGIDAGESAVDAARREVHEELGVVLKSADALGCLDDFVTRTDHAITPVVFWVDAEVELLPDPVEVHAAWRVPIAELNAVGAPRTVPGEGDGAAIVQMLVRGEWINPPTAAILWQFRDVALHGRPTRIAHVGQPLWTAR